MAENKYGIDPALIAEFVDESVELLDKAANFFIALEADPADRETIDSAFRLIHTIKGNSAFFSLLKVKALAHNMEDLLNLVREGQMQVSGSIIDLLMKGTACLRSMMERARDGGPEVDDEKMYAALLGEIGFLVKEIGEKGVVFSETAEEPGDKRKIPREEAPSGETKKGAIKTMRIAEGNIDKFLDFIGELVIVGEMYDHLQKRLMQECVTNRAAVDLKKNNEAFNNLSLSLQKSIFEIRKVPMNALLARAPLITRGLAASRKKKVNVTIKGAGVMIDKSLLESLEGPFMHMLNNSIDHGIEEQEERKKHGKPPEGNVVIEVSEDEEKVFFTIADDGAGLDKEAIKAKAVEKMLLTAEGASRLSDQELYQLIFLPGFSTAKVVTEISGRGVGMDVVKKNIDAIGGRIFIESAPGKGSRFTIQLPKSITVKIIHGVLVSTNGQRFVLPMSSVGESFELKDKDITTMPDSSQCIMRHNKIYPLLRLFSLLGLEEDKNKALAGIGIMITNEKRTIVLVVDEILGLQQVVVKKIEGLTSGLRIFSGGAILGDEKVAVVLDTERL